MTARDVRFVVIITILILTGMYGIAYGQQKPLPLQEAVAVLLANKSDRHVVTAPIEQQSPLVVTVKSRAGSGPYGSLPSMEHLLFRDAYLKALERSKSFTIFQPGRKR